MSRYVKGEKEGVMNTTIELSANEVTSFAMENKRRSLNAEEYKKNNPQYADEETWGMLEHKMFDHLVWNHYRADQDTPLHTIDPIVFKTNSIDLFPDNQGKVIFRCHGQLLINALETTKSHSGGYLHFLVPSVADGWDYAVNFCNVGFQLADEDPTIIVNKRDIKPDEEYRVELKGGPNYVYIRCISK